MKCRKYYKMPKVIEIDQCGSDLGHFPIEE